LAEALAGLARGFTSDTGVPVTVQADEIEQLPLRTEMELFRIAQEALTNVRKHARARRVEIALRSRHSTLSLSIRDDGQGLPNGSTRNSLSGSGRHGLVGMRERAKLLGGRLEVSNRPGQGTRILARIPLSATANHQP
jgi:signal transduction histidine kinase